MKLTERQKRIRRRRRIAMMKEYYVNALMIVGRHPVIVAAPLIVVMATLLMDMTVENARSEGWQQAHEEIVNIRSQEKEEEAQAHMPEIKRQQEAKQPELTTMDIYGCDSLTGQYGFPWNTMSQEWGADDVKGFYYHEISDDCKEAGGAAPVVIQLYTYIICKQYGVDYEMVFALIERESCWKWDARGDGGGSVGLMQVAERWHGDRMERLNKTDLSDPFTNVLIGVDFLAEIQKGFEGTVPDEDLPHYVLAVYNYGRDGAQRHLWNNGIVAYSYSIGIMERAKQLKEETQQAAIEMQKKIGG